jgi:pimeloyl-ACP methyl ester carboxylesterase
MSAIVGLCVAIASVGGGAGRSTLIAFGGDPAQGILVNRTIGSAPFDAPDPARPTLIFIHGFNPMPRTIHFEMAERVAEAVGSRFGPRAFNVLDWDWNGATFVGIHYDKNTEAAVQQGPGLADAILRAGLDPARVHLVGHSHGAIVAASAARTIASRTGRFVAQVTFLEAAEFYHDIVFERLGAGSASGRVENYWSPGPSAYGRTALYAGVTNIRVPSRTPWVGIVLPSHSGHVDLVRWYIETAAHPDCPLGFNASVLLR